MRPSSEASHKDETQSPHTLSVRGSMRASELPLSHPRGKVSCLKACKLLRYRPNAPSPCCHFPPNFNPGAAQGPEHHANYPECYIWGTGDIYRREEDATDKMMKRNTSKTTLWRVWYNNNTTSIAFVCAAWRCSYVCVRNVVGGVFDIYGRGT